MSSTGQSSGTPVAIYARYSTDRQDARSIDDQLRRCRALAKDRGYDVVAEYRDAAQSGAHLQRVDMQRMLADARRSGGAPFRAVLVDDLSRLSRDLGNTWQIVFGEFAACDVRVIDVTTGMASDGAGARLTFGALALVNDTFLQLVRTETHRGLEGRALAGFWTGGRVYGYSTVREENPPDPEHPRAVPVINPVEAEVVQRVFRLYAEGHGQKRIAALLNAEHVPAPYDREYSKRAGKGWGHSTVRAMLRNERYLGKWTWNKVKWVTVPGKKVRKARKRPPSEWVVREVPDLAIISRELWEKVQSRFRARRSTSKGRAHGEGKTPQPLSGLLRCGLCGSAMSIVSAQVKNGKRYPNFGCAARHSKGDGVCGNRMVVSAQKVSDSVFGTLRSLLATPVRLAEVLAGYQEERARTDQSPTPSAALRDQIVAQERRVQNMVKAVASAGWSDALGAQLREEELQLKRLKAQLEASEAQVRRQENPFDLEMVKEHLKRLAQLAEKAPALNREALQLLLGSVTLTPREEAGERFYEASGELLRHYDPATVEGDRVVDRSDCGGRI